MTQSMCLVQYCLVFSVVGLLEPVLENERRPFLKELTSVCVSNRPITEYHTVFLWVFLAMRRRPVSGDGEDIKERGRTSVPERKTTMTSRKNQKSAWRDLIVTFAVVLLVSGHVPPVITIQYSNRAYLTGRHLYRE